MHFEYHKNFSFAHFVETCVRLTVTQKYTNFVAILKISTVLLFSVLKPRTDDSTHQLILLFIVLQ